MLVIVAFVFCVRWYLIERRAAAVAGVPPDLDGSTCCGFVANFFDTLGIGFFATTTSAYKLRRWVASKYPRNVKMSAMRCHGGAGTVFISTVTVGFLTLIAMILPRYLGAWLGAGIVRMPRRAMQLAMGVALLVAAGLF